MYFFYKRCCTNRSTLRNVGKPDNWVSKSAPHSKQAVGDGDSCGVICCMFAEFFVRRGYRSSLHFDANRASINRHRIVIWRRMLNAAIRSSKLCRQCGEEDCPQSGNVIMDSCVSFVDLYKTIRILLCMWHSCMQLRFIEYLVLHLSDS